MNLTIKNIPEHIHLALKRAAAEHKRSLNDEVICALTKHAEETMPRQRKADSWNEIETFVASLPKLSSSVPLIREDRQRR